MRSRPLSDDDKAILAEVPLLAALGEDRFAGLVRGCRVEFHERGTHLFRAEDIADHFYVMLSGQLRLVRTSAQGIETVMHFLASPGAFAEAVTLAGRPYPVNCEVVHDSEIAAIPREAYLEVLRAAPEVAGDVLSGLLEWERFLMREIYRLRHANPLQRIAFFLLDFEDRQRENAENDGQDIDYPEKRQIASRIGMTAETFSRSLRKLENMNFIGKGRNLEILDRPALEKLARTG
ncbi:MAG: Crp/Fnr family transcriptional regulator [Pseudomonadota bacterium]